MTTPATPPTPDLTCARCGAARRPWSVFETGWPNRVRYWCVDEKDCRPWWIRWGVPRRLYRWFA